MTASVGRARARIGLLGNPGDLYGGKVLAATIDAFETVATVTDTVFYAPASFQPDVADLQRLAVARVAPSKGAIALGLTTDVPVQSGLSGSSAILLATLRALDAHLDLGPRSARDGTDRLGHRTRGSRHRRRPPGSRHPGPRRPPVHGLLRPRRDRRPRVSRSRSPPAACWSPGPRNPARPQATSIERSGSAGAPATRPCGSRSPDLPRSPTPAVRHFSTATQRRSAMRSMPTSICGARSSRSTTTKRPSSRPHEQPARRRNSVAPAVQSWRFRGREPTSTPLPTRSDQGRQSAAEFASRSPRRKASRASSP